MVKKATKTMPLSVDEIDTMYRSMLKVEDGDSILKSIGKVPSFDTERVLTTTNFKTSNANFKPSNNFKTPSNNFKTSNFSLDKKPWWKFW